MFANPPGRSSASSTSDDTREFHDQLDRSIRWHAEHPDEIQARLKHLEREWDVDRALAAGASALSLLGVALGFTGRRRWLALPAVMQGFAAQHSLQGWCPPLPVLRRLGFRTAAEIEAEKRALTDLLSVAAEQAVAVEDELIEEMVVLEEFTVVGGR